MVLCSGPFKPKHYVPEYSTMNLVPGTETTVYYGSSRNLTCTPKKAPRKQFSSSRPLSKIAESKRQMCWLTLSERFDVIEDRGPTAEKNMMGLRGHGKNWRVLTRVGTGDRRCLRHGRLAKNERRLSPSEVSAYDSFMIARKRSPYTGASASPCVWHAKFVARHAMHYELQDSLPFLTKKNLLYTITRLPP